VSYILCISEPACRHASLDWPAQPFRLCQLLEDPCHSDYIMDQESCRHICCKCSTHISGRTLLIVFCWSARPCLLFPPLNPFSFFSGHLTLHVDKYMYRGCIRIRRMHATNTTYGTRKSHRDQTNFLSCMSCHSQDIYKSLYNMRTSYHLQLVFVSPLPSHVSCPSVGFGSL